MRDIHVHSHHPEVRAWTADPQLESLMGVGGLAPFSRVYNAAATESRKVGDFGSGGPIP
jgi:hypothetical protein